MSEVLSFLLLSYQKLLHLFACSHCSSRVDDVQLTGDQASHAGIFKLVTLRGQSWNLLAGSVRLNEHLEELGIPEMLDRSKNNAVQ